MNLTQKINRARKARGLAALPYSYWQAFFSARSPAQTMRAVFFDNRKPGERRALRLHFDIGSVLPA